MKKNLITYLTAIIVLIFPVTTALSAPTGVSGGELFGFVKDSVSLQPLAFVNVVIKSGENVVGHASTDERGKYIISSITPGTYTVEASYVSYRTLKYTGVTISAEQILQMNFIMSGFSTDSIIVIGYIHPLINIRDVSTVFNMEPEDIEHTPLVHDINDMAAGAPGIYQRDLGQPLNVRGSREEATQYIIDGIKVTGTPSVPSGAIEQMSVFTGGIPAEFGDATGGVIVITTKSYFSRRDQ